MAKPFPALFSLMTFCTVSTLSTAWPQKLNHHPDIDIRYDKVTLTLTTHDEGGLTEKDFSIAQQCDEVFAKFVEARTKKPL